MTTESVGSWTPAADLFLPADGVTLLGEQQDNRHSGRRFLVRLSDGQVIQLPLLLYLVMAAIAEGAVDGGWSAAEIGGQVGAASGQRLTADNVRYLVAGKLAPLGLIAAEVAGGPDGTPAAAPSLRGNPLPARSARGGVLLRHRAAGVIDRVLSWPVVGRAERLAARYRRRRWALALGGIAVLVSVAAAAPIMAGTRSPDASGARAARGTGSASAAEASWSQAAAWVAQQVSRDVSVWCDPGMGRLLRQDGFPGGRLKPLPGGQPILLGPGLVVVTSVVRGRIGPRAAADDAPQIIASFGSGTALVQVRTIAPAGPAAFSTQLAAEQTALASAGRQLLDNKNIQLSLSARAALRAGQVDARLLTILVLLSAQMPVRLVGFPGAPGAGPRVPLRDAEIALTSQDDRSAVSALVNAQRSPYRPTMAVGAGNGSRSVVDLRFDVPASMEISQ